MYKKDRQKRSEDPFEEEILDKEWDEDPLDEQLRYYYNMREKGVIYDPAY